MSHHTSEPVRPALTSSRVRPLVPGAGPGSRAVHRPVVEPLEDRCLLALLGLTQLDQKPDIASGWRTSMSYTQIGNNDNPFVYSATPLSIKMPDGSADNITNQTNKTAAKTTLTLYLDNFGDFVSAGTSPDFSINGHVVIAGTTYDGTPAAGPGPGVRLLEHDHDGRRRVRRPADDHRRAADAVGRPLSRGRLAGGCCSTSPG